MPALLSLLTFPQRLKNGNINFNILIVPRNIDPLQALKPGEPSFADANLTFEACVIDSLVDLPELGSAGIQTFNPVVSGSSLNLTNFYTVLKKQFKATQGVDLVDAASPSDRAIKIANNIRKYLPESYRSAFNFTNPKTQYASIDDSYHCAVKNNKAKFNPKVITEIPWGKAFAFCLRNPLVAKQAGLVYNASIPAAGLYDKGGWLFVRFAAGSDYDALDQENDINIYAARIPSLKNEAERILFAPVLFRVLNAAIGDGLDQVFEEAIGYNDGFAHIVHSNQPVNQYYLEEKDLSNPPMKDTGIRLGWDDEQLLIWHNRQLSQKDEASGLPVDAPLGVSGFIIDAKDITNGTGWISLNAVVTASKLILGDVDDNINIAPAGTPLETGVEVTPSQLQTNTDYWMPMYFTSWVGKSLVLTDNDAVEIYRQQDVKMPPGTKASKKNNAAYLSAKKTNPFYEPSPERNNISLLYGNDYEFRIRFLDITGGSPLITDDPVLNAPAPTAKSHFKRCVTAQALRISDAAKKPVNENTSIAGDTVLSFSRPLLGYPAVVFTGKYADPVGDLKTLANNIVAGEQFIPALPDPDVTTFKIQIEVKSLYMDNLLSSTGRDSFIPLYEKEFKFNAVDFYAPENINIKFVDKAQLKFDGADVLDDGSKHNLILPSARELRLTFIPIVEKADDKYAAKFIEFGKTISLTAAAPSNDETNLFENPGNFLKAIYLQSEEENNIPAVNAATINLKGNSLQNSGSLIQRISNELDLDSKQLSLLGRPGERIQFGCSKLIRHSLAPDNTSLTFSSKNELLLHWLMVIDLHLLRDWAWNALQPESILIERRVHSDGYSEGSYKTVGHINLSNTINVLALTEPQRSSARLMFFDAFDPKEVLIDFPREASLHYRVTPQFKTGYGPVRDGDISETMEVPVTLNPVQVPKIVSAGIAQTDYKFDEKYSTTDIRNRFLWLEFEEPVSDKKDIYYCRILGYAADPLIRQFELTTQLAAVLTGSMDLADSTNSDLSASIEPALPIAPEPIRVILKGMSNDFAGIHAMQEMTKSTSSDKHYLVPLPPGLNGDSAELFGFFTYEVRVGHSKKIWSTARGRFGRPLRATGVQHPCPALTCIATRSKKTIGKTKLDQIIISAPYAKAVQDGKNVTASPPATSLWCLLYAQVMQADKVSWRNILIDSREMFLSKPDYNKKTVHNKDGQVYGNSVYTTQEVSTMLQSLGLPTTSSLSALCVEMFPLKGQWRIHYDREKMRSMLAGVFAGNDGGIDNAQQEEEINPLREGLGFFRILRTSPLCKIEDVCCEDC